MPNSREKGWFLDLANTADEVLLLFAKEARSQPAKDELTCRYWHKFKTMIPKRARGLLGSWDVEDAQQQAFFWIQEAMRAFDPVQLSLPRGSCFRTFLNRVFRLRLSDFLRSLHRNKKRFQATFQPESERAANSPFDNEELNLQLEKALRLLDPPARALWNELRQGKRLRDLPKDLAISYRTVKRRWRKLCEQLRLTTRPEPEA